jgi:hypothetical protein
MFASRIVWPIRLDCFASLAMTNDRQFYEF